MLEQTSYFSEKKNLLLFFVLVITFISYCPSLKNGFLLWDDDVHLVNNSAIQSLDIKDLGLLFGSKGKVNDIYIPLTLLSFAIEQHFFGMNPFVYHLDNLLLHLLVVTLIFYLAIRLKLNVLGASIAALIFGIHPMHVESVAWITERKDVLYSSLYLLAILSYLKYLRERKFLFFILTVICGVLSMLAKPMALSLPLILLLCDWFDRRKIDKKALLEKIPLILLLGAMAALTYIGHARLPIQNIGQSFLVWIWTFVFYLKKFFIPTFFVPLYILPQANFQYILSLVTFIVLMIAFVFFRKERWFVFAIGFYVLSIFFLLRFDDTADTNIVADRFMYLPSLGVCLWLGYFFESFLMQRFKVVGRIAFVVIIGFLSFKTYQQSHVWHNTLFLWQHQMRFEPNHHVALNNFATELRKVPRYRNFEKLYSQIVKVQKEGLPVDDSSEILNAKQDVEYIFSLYKKAVELNVQYSTPYYNLAEIYKDVGLIEESINAYKKAIEVNPLYQEAYYALGNLYIDIGRYQDAIFINTKLLAMAKEDRGTYVSLILAYNAAIRREPDNYAYIEVRDQTMTRFIELINKNPNNPDAFVQLGDLYLDTKEVGRAISSYKMALDLNPNHKKSLYNLANTLKDLGKLDEAVDLYQKLISLSPQWSDAFLNIGVIKGRQGNEREERIYYEKAIKANPRNAKAYFNLAFLEERGGRLIEAIDLYQKSTELDPQNSEGYYNLGNAYAYLGKKSDAINAYLKAIEKNPFHLDAHVNLSILYSQMNDFKGAIKHCDEAILLGYEAPREYLKMLEVYR